MRFYEAGRGGGGDFQIWKRLRNTHHAKMSDKVVKITARPWSLRYNPGTLSLKMDADTYSTRNGSADTRSAL